MAAIPIGTVHSHPRWRPSALLARSAERTILSPAFCSERTAMSATHDHDHAGGHDHGDHSDVPSDPALRVKALESLLVEKGLVDPDALDALIETMVRDVGPRNGARVV